MFVKNPIGKGSKRAIMTENMEMVGGIIIIINTQKMINVTLILALMTSEWLLAHAKQIVKSKIENSNKSQDFNLHILTVAQ